MILTIALIGALRKIKYLFIPRPKTQAFIKQQEEKQIEHCANLIKHQISNCRETKDLYDAMDIVDDFRNIWGDSDQVKLWVDRLKIEIRNKGAQIKSKH